jgi:hypothetical protein
MPRAEGDRLERFWRSVEVGHPLGCWWWIGKGSTHGYGRFTFGRRSLGERRDVYAHRFAYEALIGPIPDGMQLDHLCRNRVCVNPDHLEIVTSAVNTSRGWPTTSTTCKRGHRLSGTNLYIQPSTGRRCCQLCKDASIRRYRARRRARRYDPAVIDQLAEQLSSGGETH